MIYLISCPKRIDFSSERCGPQADWTLLQGEMQLFFLELNLLEKWRLYSYRKIAQLNSNSLHNPNSVAPSET
jgi:hypothetical protein